MNPDSKEIRNFISSMDEDMHEERNYLLNKTFNTLREKALKRGVSLVLIDVRWGITQEESELGKVVEISYDEIINSHAFFICLVGG